MEPLQLGWGGGGRKLRGGGRREGTLRVEGKERRRWKFLLCSRAWVLGVGAPLSSKIRKHQMGNGGWGLPQL